MAGTLIITLGAALAFFGTGKDLTSTDSKILAGGWIVFSLTASWR